MDKKDKIIKKQREIIANQDQEIQELREKLIGLVGPSEEEQKKHNKHEIERRLE